MSAAASLLIILVLVTASSTFPSPIADCPESAAASGHDQPIIFDSTPPLIPNNHNSIPEVPMVLPPAHTAAATLVPYPDNNNILPGTPLIPSPKSNNILPEEAPLLPPPAYPAAAAQPEQTVTDGVVPLMQPSASTNPNGDGTGNGNGSGGEQLGADNQYENTNTNIGFGGATRAIGGGVGAQPLVDNTPFDSGSTTTYQFMAFSSCVDLMILLILV